MKFIFLPHSASLPAYFSVHVDFYGGDITHHDNVDSAEECRDRCEANDRCRVWTYTTSRHVRIFFS